jgi:hypothetical protein
LEVSSEIRSNMTVQQFVDKYFGPKATAAPYQTDVQVIWNGANPGGNQTLCPVNQAYCASSQAAADLVSVIQDAAKNALTLLLDPNAAIWDKAAAQKILPLIFTVKITSAFPLAGFTGPMYSQTALVPWFQITGTNAVGQTVTMPINAGILLSFLARGTAPETMLASMYEEIANDLHDFTP